MGNHIFAKQGKHVMQTTIKENKKQTTNQTPTFAFIKRANGYVIPNKIKWIN